MFKSGDIVKNVVEVEGEVMAYDPQLTNKEPTVNPGRSGGPGARHGEIVVISPNHTGEVLSSDSMFTVAIYPIHTTGELEPHLVRVESWTSDFKRATRHNPFKMRPRDRNKNPGKPKDAAAWQGASGIKITRITSENRAEIVSIWEEDEY